MPKPFALLLCLLLWLPVVRLPLPLIAAKPLAFAERMSNAEVPDPGMTGPLAVSHAEYDYGDTAFAPPSTGKLIELRGNVHYPTALLEGPFPLVVIMHGVHTICYKKRKATVDVWPCKKKFRPFPNYQGYNYLAEKLASHGFIVASISANGLLAPGNSDENDRAWAELVHQHLALWQEFNTAGKAPFDQLFVGHVDMSRIGTMGHSFGGENAIKHALFNKELGSPYNIKAVLALAPSNRVRQVLNHIPLAVLLAYCDGDTGLIGVQYFDDARYSLPADPAPKHTVLIHGGNHGSFNTVWTPGLFPVATLNDGADCDQSNESRRLLPEQQRAATIAYTVAFFRLYLKNETQFLPLLSGAAPPPTSALTDKIFVTYHPPDDPNLRLDVNRLATESSLVANTLGGAVTHSELSDYGICGGEGHCLPGNPFYQEPHTLLLPISPVKPRLTQLRLAWSSLSAFYQNDLPNDYRDVSRFEALQFRVGVNFSDNRNLAQQAQDFTVELTDGRGISASVRVSEVSKSLYYPPGLHLSDSLPRLTLNGVRIPLSVFTGVALQDIRSVRFKFDQTQSGALLLADLAFVATPKS